MKFIFHKKDKLYINFFQKIFFYAFNTIMKVFFTIVYIRIISLRWKFNDHPLVEYPLSSENMYILVNPWNKTRERSKLRKTRTKTSIDIRYKVRGGGEIIKDLFRYQLQVDFVQRRHQIIRYEDVMSVRKSLKSLGIEILHI